jgi:hypothetical protein
MPTWVGRIGRHDGVSWGSEIAQDTRVTVGNALATIVRVWGRNLPRFLLLTVVCYLPIVGGYAVLSIDAVEALLNKHVYLALYELHPGLDAREVVGLGWIVLAVFGAAIALCTVAELRGARTSIWRGLALAIRRTLPLIAVAFIARLATHGIALAIRIARWDPDGSLYQNADTIYAQAFFSVLWIVTSALFIAALPVAAIERRGAFAAIARGFAVLRGQWPKVLAVVLVHYVLVVALYVGLSQLMLPWIMGSEDFEHRFMIYGFIRFALELVLFALGPTVAAVIYERAREAKEGPAPDQLDRVFD